MIPFILIAAGLIILFKGRVNFSKKRELVKPHSTYIGIALVATGAITPIYFNLAMILVIAIIFISYFLSQKIVPNNDSSPTI